MSGPARDGENLVEAVPQAVHQDVDAWMQVSVLTGGCTCFSPGVGAWPGAGSSG